MCSSPGLYEGSSREVKLDEGENSASYIGVVCSPEVAAVEAVEAVKAALCLKANLEGGIGFVTNFFLEVFGQAVGY